MLPLFPSPTTSLGFLSASGYNPSVKCGCVCRSWQPHSSSPLTSDIYWKKLSWQGKLFCCRKQKSSLSGLNNYSSYNNTTSSANRNMLLQWTEIKHRQVAFRLYYVVLIYFCFATSCILLTVKQKHTSGLNSYSNYTDSSWFFQNLHSAFSCFWCINLFGGGRKTINCGEKNSCETSENFNRWKRKHFHIGILAFSHLCYDIQKRYC